MAGSCVQKERIVRRHLSNALYGALDYISYPVGMLAVVPIVLHRLGTAEYGLWMVATAVVSAGGIIAGGFGDAAIQRIAVLRGIGSSDLIVQTIRSLFGVSLMIGCILATSVWFAAPYAAAHIVTQSIPLQEGVVCLRLASALILLRAVETVAVAPQRAFGEYRRTVQVSATVRLTTLAFAALASSLSLQAKGIMVATTIIFASGAILQFRLLRKVVGAISLWSPPNREEGRRFLTTGIYVWLQATGSVIFRQLDRILLGVSLGAAAVTPYVVCIQVTEPLFGLTASSLSFFFPHLSECASKLPNLAVRRSILKATTCNIFLVVAGTIPLLFAGSSFLQVWAGSEVATRAHSILPLVLLGSAFSGISVTGTYAMQSFGRFRTVAGLTLGTRGAFLLLMFYLLHHSGVQGLAFSRFAYGVASLLVYIPLVHVLRMSTGPREVEVALPLSTGIREEVRS